MKTKKLNQTVKSYITNHKERICPYVLAIAPTTHGFGYAVFQTPQRLFDWGVTSLYINRVARSLTRFEMLVKKYQPHVVVIERPESGASDATIANKIIYAFGKYAATYTIPFKRLTRDKIKAVFNNFDATTREQISEKIIEFLPELEQVRPRKRNIWEREDSRLKIFDAVSLGLTFYESLDSVNGSLPAKKTSKII